MKNEVIVSIAFISIFFAHDLLSQASQRMGIKANHKVNLFSGNKSKRIATKCMDPSLPAPGLTNYTKSLTPGSAQVFYKDGRHYMSLENALKLGEIEVRGVIDIGLDKYGNVVVAQSYKEMEFINNTDIDLYVKFIENTILGEGSKNTLGTINPSMVDKSQHEIWKEKNFLDLWKLNYLGYYNKSPEKVLELDENMKRAVETFQSANYISKTGKINNETDDKLEKLYRNRVFKNQIHLIELGYFTESPSYKRTEKLISAVKKFQKENEMTESGIEASQTYIALREAHRLRILEYQEYLKNFSVFDGEPNGKRNELTIQSIKIFQRNTKLPITGLMDKKSYDLLHRRTKQFVRHYIPVYNSIYDTEIQSFKQLAHFRQRFRDDYQLHNYTYNISKRKNERGFYTVYLNSNELIDFCKRRLEECEFEFCISNKGTFSISNSCFGEIEISTWDTISLSINSNMMNIELAVNNGLVASQDKEECLVERARCFGTKGHKQNLSVSCSDEMIQDASITLSANGISAVVF